MTQKTMKNYDVCIAYRINAQISLKKRPVFQNDKIKLSALCLESFKRSLGNLKIKLIVILDRCPSIYETLFLKRFKKEDLEFINIEKIMDKKYGNNAFTFLKQLEVLTNQKFAEYVYFAEDDYLYIPNSFSTMLNFMEKIKADFITPYDHPDYYTSKLHNYMKEIVKYGGYIWKSVGSTCCTFLTTNKVLKSVYTFLTRYKYMGDTSMWFALTKKRWFLGKNFGWGTLLMWRYGFRQLLFGKKYSLWVPQPSLATHMLENFLAPNVEWEVYIKELAKEIEKDFKNENMY